MYITNRTDVARVAEAAGTDRIFVDMEYVGKAERQGGMDTVQSHHTVEDVRKLRAAVTKAELLVRVNPIHEKNGDFCGSEEEIRQVTDAGADVIMLPFFKTAEEVRKFVSCVGGKAKTMLLVETPEAVSVIDDILRIPGIDEVHIGLNDLSLGLKKTFMFEPLADGTVERLTGKFKEYGVSYGFGGIAALGKGMLPSEKIIKEHYRLGSTCAILSRSFCNVAEVGDINEIERIFQTGLADIRALEAECMRHDRDSEYFTGNRAEVVTAVGKIVKILKEKKK